MSPQLIVNGRALNEDPATSLAVVIEKGLKLMDKHLKTHRRGCCRRIDCWLEDWPKRWWAGIQRVTSLGIRTVYVRSSRRLWAKLWRSVLCLISNSRGNRSIRFRPATFWRFSRKWVATQTLITTNKLCRSYKSSSVWEYLPSLWLERRG